MNLREGVRDVAEYLENPINSFLYLKSLTQFLTCISTSVKEPIFKLLILYEEIDKSVGWPTYKDVEGAASALMRLQSTYNLDIDQLIQGRIFKNYKSGPLTVLDCFTIGETALKRNNDKLANVWLEKAFSMCNNNGDCDAVLKIKITEYYAYATFIEGNLIRALELTEFLLGLKPKHERALTNKQFLLDEINNLRPSQRSGEFMVNPFGNYDIDRVYYFGCQGLMHPPKEVLSKLKCRYVHHNNPYLRIAPVKEEEAYLDPRIVIYKDVLYDSEIQELKALARQKLMRSKIQGEGTTEMRVSKIAWLLNEVGNVRKVCSRFASYSNLSAQTAEPLQVVNYGLGGHYIPHLDAFSMDVANKIWKLTGNRIATFLVYLNDVDEGGNTVFPYLGVSVKPEKGSAVVWHNLHRNGSRDDRTLHAACPVLLGTKWAANLWFHEAGHEFSRPCPLSNPQM